MFLFYIPDILNLRISHILLLVGFFANSHIAHIFLFQLGIAHIFILGFALPLAWLAEQHLGRGEPANRNSLPKYKCDIVRHG